MEDPWNEKSKGCLSSFYVNCDILMLGYYDPPLWNQQFRTRYGIMREKNNSSIFEKKQ